jgi:hypothetical protein
MSSGFFGIGAAIASLLAIYCAYRLLARLLR